jgi:hypothetical protein
VLTVTDGGIARITAFGDRALILAAGFDSRET